MLATVRRWDAVGLATMLDARPALRAIADRPNRTLLHLCCAVKPETAGHAGDRVGRRTVDALLARGLALEGIEPIADDGEIFPATPLWYAVARGENAKLVRHLLDLGARADWCLWAVVWRDDAALMRTLLATQPALDRSFAGETPLFYAARLQRLKTLQLLLDAGADPTIADRRGRTPAAIARAPPAGCGHCAHRGGGARHSLSRPETSATDNAGRNPDIGP